jgi:predicted esterase
MSRAFKDDVEFLYPESVVLVDFPVDPGMVKLGTKNLRSWFNLVPKQVEENVYVNAYTGLADNLIMLQEYFDKNGPIDGIVGFSQGCSMGLILVSLMHREKFRANIKFIVMFSATVVADRSYWEFIPRDFPAIFIVGVRDQIKLSTYGQLQYLPNAPVFEYEVDHRVPLLSDEHLGQIRRLMLSGSESPKL